MASEKNLPPEDYEHRTRVVVHTGVDLAARDRLSKSMSAWFTPTQASVVKWAEQNGYVLVPQEDLKALRKRAERASPPHTLTPEAYSRLTRF